MNFNYYIGPIHLTVDWNREDLPQRVHSLYLKHFIHRECESILKIDIEVLSSVFNLSVPPQKKLSELRNQWQVWPMATGWLLQIWSGDSHRYVLEAEINHEFTKAQIKCLNDQAEQNHLPYLIATLTKWMTVHLLSYKGGFLLHSAAIQEKMGAREVILGCAPSGGGKTTFSSFFHKHELFDVLTDETVLILPSCRGFQAYGTPWFGMLGVAKNSGGTISNLFLLEKTMEHRLTSLSLEEAYLKLIKEVFLPHWNQEVTEKILTTLFDFIHNTSIKILSFQKSSTIVDFIVKNALRCSWVHLRDGHLLEVSNMNSHIVQD